MKRTLLTRALLLTLIVLLLPAFALGKGGKGGGKRQLSGERVTANGSIDWKKGVLFATGHGAISNKIGNLAKAYLRARNYAKYDAIANLLMVVDHVRIDSHTVGKDFEADTEIRADIQGVVRGAQIVDERKIPMGNSVIVEVTVATPLYGDQGIASVFIPEIARRHAEPAPEIRPQAPDNDEPLRDPEPERRLPEPPPVDPTPDEPAPPEPSRQDDPIVRHRDTERFTSLIIDVRGQGVERSMSPKIRRPDGSEVWGTVHANLDFVIDHGIVVYANSLGEARRDGRAGDNPLVVHAVGRAGARFHTDATVSEEDAERILAENSRCGFLNKYRVIFVVDPGK